MKDVKNYIQAKSETKILEFAKMDICCFIFPKPEIGGCELAKVFNVLQWLFVHDKAEKFLLKHFLFENYNIKTLLLY